MITAKEAAFALGVIPRRVRRLCEQGRIRGARKVGNVWMLPNNPKVSQGDRIHPSAKINFNQDNKNAS